MKSISNNHIVIRGWMVERLKLNSNELITYALIYGFTQDDENYFTGSVNYICNWLNCSRPTVMKSLKILQEKNLIIKNQTINNNVIFNTYKVNLHSKEFLQGGKVSLQGGGKEFLQGGSKETLHNNNIINNTIIDNTNYKENEFFEFDSAGNLKTEKKEKEKSCAKKEKENEQIFLPYDFKPVWELWKEYRKEMKIKNFASNKFENIAIRKLIEISLNNPETALKIVENSISNGYRGLFEIKNNQNQNILKPTEKKVGYQTADTMMRNLQNISKAVNSEVEKYKQSKI